MITPKKITRVLANRSGYFTSLSTPTRDIREFLKRLRPVNTGIPLIRVGGENDGGYLLPDDLADIENCFSPGVSTTATFEEDLYRRGIRSFLADYSVDGPPASLAGYAFDKKFLGSYNSDSHFTLAHWVNSRLPDHAGDLILQMDIEGSEYPVLMETSEEILKKFRIIVVEFHFMEQLFNREIFPLLREAFAKLLRHFCVVHIHPNNYRKLTRYGNVLIPNLVEMTFLRLDRAGPLTPCTKFPHPLDRRNMPEMADVVLPACWYDFT